MNTNRMNGIFIVPTGVEARCGGDAGAHTQVNLIASVCNRLYANPNSIHASDINCMADNVRCLEGSTINRFLSGDIFLEEPRTYNKILCLVNDNPVLPATINAVNAARHTLSADIEIKSLKTPLIMTAKINNKGIASGFFTGVDELIEQVRYTPCDVICLHTPISCDNETVMNYWNNGGVNPWGGIESAVSKYLSTALNKQVIHSPVETQEDFLCDTIIVKKSQAAEIISLTYSWCMYKSAHTAPRISLSSGISNKDIDVLISPMCWDEPHDACMMNDIPIVLVKDNTTCLKKVYYPDYNKLIYVQNYCEAAGIIASMNARINYKELY